MIVGGAQRKNRKQKQAQTAAAARAVAAARGTRRDTTKIAIGVVVILLVAAAVVGGVLYEKHQSDVAATAAIPNLTVPGSNKYPAVFDKSTATILVGKSTAKVTIDAYEDFLCPICAEFETTNFNEEEKQLEAGTLKVRYHLLNLLDNDSNPAGYSMRSANTALAVATAAPNKFMNFHYSLYNKQPKEGDAGWSQAQLNSLANRLGVTGPLFDSLVNNKTYNTQIQKNLNDAENNKALWLSNDGTSAFGTPTIVPNGQAPVSRTTWIQGPGWLDALIKAAYPS